MPPLSPDARPASPPLLRALSEPRVTRVLARLASLCLILAMTGTAWLVAPAPVDARVSSREYLEQQLAESRDFRNRAQAALGLGRIADRRSRGALERALRSDSNPAVRAAAAASLGKLGDRRALAALRRAMRDDSAAVRRQAESSMAEIQSGGADGASASRPIRWGSIRYVVVIGDIRNSAGFGGAALDAPLRAAILRHLGGVSGVVGFGSAAEIDADAQRQIGRRRIRRYRMDGVLREVQRTVRHGEVRVRCAVNLTLLEENSRNVLGMLSGAAAATEPVNQARGSRGPSQEVRMASTALEAAVRGALSSARSALDQAARR